MKLSGNGKLLRIFIGEADSLRHRPLYEALILAAREAGLAGATATRGIAGFGAVSRVLHTSKVLRLSEDLPVVVEIVDEEEKLRAFLPRVDAMFAEAGCGGLVTIEHAEVITYTHGS